MVSPRGSIIEGGGDNGKFFRRNIFISQGQEDILRKEFNNTDTYATILSYDSTNQEEAMKYGPFYIDLDHPDFNIVKKDANSIIAYMNCIFGIPKEMLRLYYSGNKGIHIIVPEEVFDIKPSKDLHCIFRLMAEELETRTTEYTVNTKTRRTLDIAIYDCRRLFRLVNSINSKSMLYKIPITLNELEELDEQDIRELAKVQRIINVSKAKVVPKAKKCFENYALRWKARKDSYSYLLKPSNGSLKNIQTPPCIQYILENFMPQGCRNEVAVVLSSFYNQYGLSSEETLEAISEWNLKRCDPPLEPKEIKSVVSSVYKKGYKFGCRGIKRYAECNQSSCSLVRRK
jgi:hypothetical protein